MGDVGKIFKSFKILLVVAFITFSILVTFFVLHKNSVFDIFKEFNAFIEEKKNLNISEPDKDLKNNTFEAVKDDLSLSTTSGNDKLFGGLLVSSFNESSCISRFQSYLYRKASPHKPSKYLISKLRNYEHLHQRCGPYTKFYNETMENGAKRSNNYVDLRCKYLVWIASDGLGNRMISLVSTFLYAILTNRVLLVRFDVDMLNLFCEPFFDSSWLLPKNSPYWNDLKQFETHETLSMNNKKNNSLEFVPPVLVLDLTHTHVGHTNLFHCDQNQDLLQKVHVMILQSNQYFVPSLFMISSFRQDLNKMFLDKDTIFHYLGRYLFHPSNRVWERIRKLYEANLAKENEKIGLQVRVFNIHHPPTQTITNEIISCVHQAKLLPKFNVQSSMNHHLKNNTSKVVLVVSLYSQYGEKLKSIYESNTSLSREVIKVYQPSHEEQQNSNDDMHNIKAWTEIYLLSLCDALVTSSMSTFGYVAHSLGGLKPWILQPIYGETVPDPPCQRAKYVEPCFHYPPKYACKTNVTVDFTSLFHHITHCEDVSSGVKNSVFDLVHGFNVLAVRAHNASNNVLKQGTQNAITTNVVHEGAQNASIQEFQNATVKTGEEKDHNVIPDSAPVDRVLLVKFGADMSGLFCEPFPDSSWLLPRSFPYWKDQKHIETYENILNNFKHTHDRHNNFFHCDGSQDLLQKISVLILRSDQYFVPSLFMIPSFREELSKMFPQKDTVFHHLGRYLLHPSNKAWQIIRKIYEAHLAKANERIGLQIRLFNTHRLPHQTVINQIVSCTLQHKLLPDFNAQKSVASPLKKTSKVVLVASLFSEYGEKLKTMYQANRTVTREVIRVYQPSHEERQKSNDDMHNIKAWTEIYLLSLCDALVTSTKSTFGYVAHSLGGLKPWILQRGYNETIPDPPCRHAKSMEPCFHYPPKYDCRANSTVDFTSLFNHMKHCEDVSGGLKLVNGNH
ncbi:Galactoside 2-alpha-L-fucosyltransferase [Vigna angularis]|uniref:Galactoside 2-alpha-L-fucosyltransferase n=1 Tax=Phaseolus angularis TaxID=3914 RepID=A0A8T0JDW0_PHAAN|nr:Galactoside 2-alpha-L-fucosyltransferase [Vigna angularis]